MKVLVSGAGGMLGRAVSSIFHTALPGVSLTLTSKNVFDITSVRSVSTVLLSVKPDILVNCAAYTKVDKAEQEKEIALMANAVGPGILAEACRKSGSKMIHISTDYVFRGTHEGAYKENDPVNPQSAYGATKLEGEKRVLAALPHQALIIRTAWLYGPGGPNFVKTIAAKGKEL
ncbi:MAG: NAD(P)-dependent oxidoreductase, partial [Nitrospinota bacterium]|nr:NAD(P)-dependent oxidoreductase [Nitrospinota bacterium]